MTSAESSNDATLMIHEDNGTCVYTDYQRSSSLLHSTKRSYKESLYSDVTLVVDGTPFKCHKIVLASLSEYFPPLFQYQSKDEEVLLNETPATADNFATILSFAYTGDVQLSKENVQDMLITANFFGISFIATSCETFMSNNLDSETACDALQFATNLSLKILLRETEKFICKNLESVSKTTGYLKLDSKFLLKFFDNENLILSENGEILSSVAREELVLDAVLRYLSQTFSPDESLIDAMIRTVRLPVIPTENIKQCIRSNKSLKNNELLKKYTMLSEKAANYLKVRKRPTGVDAENMPESWFRLRRPAAFKFILGERRYASGGEVGPCHLPPRFSHQDPEIEIKKIVVRFRFWDERRVLGGITITYRGSIDDESTPLRTYSKGATLDSWEKHEALLEPQEKITAVIINSGWMIDRIGFVTNENRRIGPFGGVGGAERTVAAPPGTLSYLHDIACDEVMTQGSFGLHNLLLRWVTFK